MFTHLHCHSNYSLLSGADKIETLLAKAKLLGMGALAITDTDGLYGAIPFYKAARALGIKPIIGVQITDGRTRAVMLARNSEGYSNLCRIVTEKQSWVMSHESWVKNGDPSGFTNHQSPVVHSSPITHDPSPNAKFNLVSTIAKYREDLFILTPSIKLIRGLSKIGIKDNLFAEICRSSKEDNPYERKLLAFSERHGIPLVATNNAHFSGADGYNIHKLLSAIRERSTVKTVPSRLLASPEAYLKSEGEMKQLFSDIPEALGNASMIAEMCEFKFDLGKWKFPKFVAPDGVTSPDYLRNLCVDGAQKRYGRCDGKIVDRLNYELSIISDLYLSDYFLIVWDINRFAKREGIPSVGRGSAADSLVSYLLFLTNVDPIRHDLFFERFLNRERKDPPDIDLDFCWRRRDRVLDYVYKKYGPEHVAMISSHVTFGGRSAMREVTKALGIPLEEVSHYIEKLPHWGDVDDIEKAKEKVPECASLPLDKEPLKTIYETARYIDGYPRHLSIHPGGIVIAPSPITDFIPLEMATKGIVVTQFDMYPVEDMGLLKIDLLGQRSLSVIDDTVKNLKRERGIGIDFAKDDPIEDEKTKNLIKRGETIGCFYIESPGMRLLLKKLKCDTFENLVAASSIIRPGVAESGMMREFIERHNGTRPVTYLHPAMERNLKTTFGVMIYQEDVIRVASDFAGMSFGEADNLRRCMSKKRNWEAMEKYRDRFINGAMARGAEKQVAEEIWRQVESFGGYAFCKAHSASYAQISYQAAYLKAYYPAEFMASVISNYGGFYHTSEYVEEARRMGIKILLPDINKSEKYFTGSKDWIRIGLSQVKGIHGELIDTVIEERKKSFYISLNDFLDRTEALKKDTASLIKCGAFDSFEFSRPELLWKLELCFGKMKKAKPRENETRDLPFRDNGWNSCSRIIPRIRDYSTRTKLKIEKELLDLTASSHPLDLFQNIDKSLPVTGHRSSVTNSSSIIAAKDIGYHVGREINVIGWIVTSKRVKTKKGDMMKFLTMEDKTATFEVTLFPRTYRECGAVLSGRGPYVVKGHVDNEFGGITVTATDISCYQ
jgi:DNA polymerase III subunit alpha